MPEISKIKLTSGDEYNIKDTTAREMISSHTHTNESMGFGYGTCDTAASTTAKTVSIPNYKLTNGGIVSIKFDYEVLADDTLNINNTGAKPIYYNGSAITDGIIKAGDTATFIYDGTNYNLISLDRNFNFTNESMGFGYSDTNYSCFCGIIDDALTDGDIIICGFDYDVPANATLNINSTGDKPIYYNGSPITDGIIEANDAVILKYNENLDLSFSRFDFIGLYEHYKLDVINLNPQEITIFVPYALTNGQNFNIRFEYDVPANATLNINSGHSINSTGAKPIYYNGSIITDNIIKAGDIATFIYNINDGRYDLLATDNYNNENVNHYYYATTLICYRITLDGYTQIKGGIVSIKFNHDVLSDAILNINHTGDTPIFYNNAPITDGIIKAGDTATFIYDGTNYNLISLDRDFNDPITVDTALSTTSTNPVENNVITNALNNKADNTHTHTNESMGFGFGICDTTTSITAKTVSIPNYKLTNGGIVSIKFDYDVPANATLNINSKGAKSIYYKGSTITDDIIKAGDTATFIYDGTNYNLISLDRDFDFNENSILKCDIKNSTPFGNTLPISTSMNLYTLNNIKYKVIIATFDFYVYRASTINQIPIYYNNSVIQNDIIYPGDTATFIYDGTNNRYELINIDTKIDNDRIIIPYAKSRYFECTTDSATLAKSVSTNNSYNINENYIISVKFTNDVPANATLNINNNGDKPIYNNGSAIRNNVIKANDNVIFIYDGSKYKLMRNFNMTTAGNMFGLAYYSNSCIHSGICNTDASDTNKRVDVGDNSLTTYEFDKLTIKFTNAVPANSTLNNIPIYYNSAPIIDNIINAGDTVEFICDGSNYHLLHSYIDISLKDIDNRLNNKSDSTHTHINESMGQGYTIYNTNITSQNNNAIYACNTNYTPINNDQFIIKFNNDVPANATLNINNTGDYPIYCSAYLNDSRESETISIRSGGIPAITLTYSYVTDIEGMIKSGDIAVVRYLESLNNEKIYYVEFTDTHNNENTISYYTEINNASTNISATIENYTVVHYNYMAIKFTNDVPANATLNINNTGDIHIYYNGSYITDGIIKAGDTAILYYTAIRVIGAIYGYALQYANNENTNLEYVKYLNGNYFYDIELDNYTLTTGGIISIKFNNNIYNNGLLNINNTGYKLIYYKGSTITDDIIKAGDTATFIYDGTNYNLISLDRDFNPITVDTALSTTSTNPVQNNIITNALNNKADSTHTHTNESMGFGFGICDIAASTTAKTVSIPNYKLTNGGIVSIGFDCDVRADDTLNINNTGAKLIYYNYDIYSRSDIIKAGDIATFLYSEDNDAYILISLNRNFNFTNESMGFGFGICDIAASTTAKTVSIPNYKLTNGGIVSIGFDFDVRADATLNINNTGDKPIYYNGSAITDGIIKAGDTATFIYNGTNYNLISLDRDFNPITVDTALSTTSTNPVQNSVITNALNNKADNTHTHTNESMGFGYSYTNYSYFCGIVDDYNTLTDGDIIICGFDYDVPANATLNINSTGDKPIYYNGSAITEGIINAGDTVILKYNENLDLSFSRFDFIGLYHFYELFAHNLNSQEEINIDAPIYEIEMINGQIFNIRFDYDVPANATLNIDGIDDDAKPIYHNGAPIIDGIIKAEDNVIFIYNINDGRYDLLATDNYNNENVNHCYYDFALICYRITLDGYTQTKDGMLSIKFYNNVAPNATLNINSTGAKPIYYNGAPIIDGIIKAGDTATFIYDGTNYNLISLDRDFNPITVDTALSTTSTNPVQNNVITNALNNYIPTIVGTQIESTNNWTGNAQFETLEDGQRILYYLPYDNSSGSDVVLNLTLADGTTQTGNINCYLSGSTRLNSQYEAGNFIPLIYKENIAFNGSSTTYTGWWAYTDKDIDSKVQNTLNNTTKAYITGTTNNTTNIGTQIFDNNVYLGTTAGELNTKSLKLNEKVTLNYNTNNNCIDFIFS